MDFGSIDAANPLLLQYDFGPGTDLEGTGTIVLFGNDPSTGAVRRRLSIDAFYVAPPLATVNIEDVCPLFGSELLPPDETYPLTLFVLGGQQNRTVYACNEGAVVGISEFEYVGKTTPSPQVSPSPTTVST